ncbi:uncharacterized protein LOC144166981 [Haemaphysalis longicornis]
MFWCTDLCLLVSLLRRRSASGPAAASHWAFASGARCFAAGGRSEQEEAERSRHQEWQELCMAYGSCIWFRHTVRSLPVLGILQPFFRLFSGWHVLASGIAAGLEHGDCSHFEARCLDHTSA